MLKIVKTFGRSGSASNPAGGAHSAHTDPLAGGEGLLPLPKNPTPALVLRSWSPMKNPGIPLIAVQKFLQKSIPQRSDHRHTDKHTKAKT